MFDRSIIDTVDSRISFKNCAAYFLSLFFLRGECKVSCRAMKGKSVRQNEIFKSAAGAVLVAFCGLVLWKARLCESWSNASYDYLFRFGARAVTNKVVLGGSGKAFFWMKGLAPPKTQAALTL